MGPRAERPPGAGTRATRRLLAPLPAAVAARARGRRVGLALLLACATAAAAGHVLPVPPVQPLPGPPSAALPAPGGLADPPLQAWLEAARARAAPPCAGAPDRLAAALCSGTLRIGVRGDYAPFAVLRDGVRSGFEIELAALLAARLGVTPVWVGVNPADRIAALGEGRVDLVLATTGHTRLRDTQALFVRPHYYQSQTVVLGRRELPVHTLEDLAGRTVCVTVGNSTNATLSAAGARLMLWPDARALLEQLGRGACALGAQDDSLFVLPLQQPGFAARHEVKLAFAPQHWGAMVPREGGAPLAQALGRVLQKLHADGTLRRLAADHGVETPFLQAEQQRWSAPPCDAPAAAADPACARPPADLALKPTRLAPWAERVEAALRQHLGWQVTLAMLKTEVALKLFLQGMVFSLALVAGAVAGTLALALAFGAGLAAPQRALRWPLRAVLLASQSTPLILLMVFAGVIVSALGRATPGVALGAAILVLSLFNGSNAGQAIAEARASLRAEGAAAPLRNALWRARAQMLAFVVNATRGSPAASVIGVPELLAAQTDIASFSSERVTTFTLLLVFYMLLVSAVVWAGNRLLARWEAAPAVQGARDA